jgi:hypothetical protein
MTPTLLGWGWLLALLDDA